MAIELQLKIKENDYYKRYLKEHSYWYKILNRDPDSFKNFVESVKKEYSLRPEDRIKKTLDALELVQNLMASFK